MDQSQIVDAQNYRSFTSTLALETYTQAHGLMAAEECLLNSLQSRLTGKALLDIGVGAGRTTPALLKLSSDYTAIDYSQVLAAETSAKFNLSSVYCCDVRDMSRFPNAKYDFVFFSFNGLDYIPHQGRLQGLHEIYRVLKPGGTFLFSSHNRAYLMDPNRAERQYSRAQWVKRTIWRIALYPRHLRLRRHEIIEKEYAIVNDSGLRYSLYHYYIDIPNQIAQLEKAGFIVENAYDMQGAPAAHNSHAAWIHYLAGKPK
jgi:ubiquinone/menaquinone biosynthesis C-methylase UbiE